MAVPETPKTSVEQIQEQIARLETDDQWQKFQDSFHNKLSNIQDSLTPEQLVNIQTSLEAQLDNGREIVSKQLSISYQALKSIIEIQLDTLTKTKTALAAIATGAAETSTTAVGAVIGSSALGKGLDMMSNILESIGKVASNVWEYLKPYLEKFASTPFVKFFIGEEGERKLQAWLGINPDDEKVKKEIIDRLPHNVELIPDPANKQNDRVAMIRFNDSYDSLANNKPASKGLFFSRLMTQLNISPAPTTDKKITLTQIADAAAKYVQEQPPVVVAPTPTPAPAPAPATATAPPATK